MRLSQTCHIGRRLFELKALNKNSRCKRGPLFLPKRRENRTSHVGEAFCQEEGKLPLIQHGQVGRGELSQTDPRRSFSPQRPTGSSASRRPSVLRQYKHIWVWPLWVSGS